PEDELADGPAPADAGDEEPDEGSPGDGPREDEERPAPDPSGVLVRLEREGALDDVVQVAAGVLEERLEDVNGRPDDEHEEHQEAGQGDVQDREALDPALEPRDDREKGEPGDHEDGGELHRGVDRYAREEVMEPGVDLRDG